MSCDAAALAFALHLASAHPAAAPPTLYWTVSAQPPSPLMREPLFASIVQSATRLRSEVDGFKRVAGPATGWRPTGYEGFRAQVASLSALDMQGHVELAKRGTDGDLKCILKGISQDLPRRLADVDTAKDVAARRAALDEIGYLLRDNVEVITTPPKTASTDVARPS